MKINLIAACDNDGIIGVNGKIPWDIPADRKRFKAITTGHPVIMGRKTWESLPVKPLPNRENMVITNSKGRYAIPVSIAMDLSCAIYYLSDQSDKISTIWIIGGERLYREALPMADKIYLTRVNQTTEYNEYTDEVARFPLFAMKFNDWEITEEEVFDGYSFQVWEKP